MKSILNNSAARLWMDGFHSVLFYGLNVKFPWNSSIETLTPQVMASEGEDSGKHQVWKMGLEVL